MSDWSLVTDCDGLFVFDDSYIDFFEIHHGGIYIEKTCRKFKEDHDNKSFVELEKWVIETYGSLSDKSTWLMCYFGECKKV